MATKKKTKPEEAATYSKEQLYKSELMKNYRDVVQAIFEEDKCYTKEEAISLIKEFLERKV